MITNAGGNRLDVVVRVGTGRGRIGCDGIARQARRSAHLPRLRTGREGGAQWHWFVGDGAPRAKLRVRVRCVFPDHKVRRGSVARSVGPGPFYGVRPFRELIKADFVRRERWVPPKKQDGSGESGADLYPHGQCTWYVATKRPDLPYFPGESGDAKNWIQSAQKRDIPTGTTPRLGAVAVFQPGQYGAGYYGHVAYVTAVNDKTITVAEANYREQPIGSTRTLSRTGIRFVYQIDDGTPTSPPPASPPPSPPASMGTARASHTATPLANGNVLVTGGRPDGATVVASAELYDSASSTWTPVPDMTTARIFHTATLLANGKVLVTGGQSALGGSATASAELYDPASNTWTPAANMRYPRMLHTATLLASGKVLVTGGQLNLGGPAGANADLYDPASNTWTALPNMAVARASHTATLLADNKVLIAGGDPGGGGATAAAELFDPASNTWKPVPNMPVARAFHTATLLANRLVLVTGGDTTGGGSATAIAEVYNPVSNAWVRLTHTMSSARMFHTATRLANDEVLVTGGQSTLGGSPLAAQELYDPASNTWTPAAGLGTARVGHRTTLMANGTVLVTGGDPTGKVFVTGGESSVSASATVSAELYPEPRTR
jgi:surface antigen